MQLSVLPSRALQKALVAVAKEIPGTVKVRNETYHNELCELLRAKPAPPPAAAPTEQAEAPVEKKKLRNVGRAASRAKVDKVEAAPVEPVEELKPLDLRDGAKYVAIGDVLLQLLPDKTLIESDKSKPLITITIILGVCMQLINHIISITSYQ